MLKRIRLTPLLVVFGLSLLLAGCFAPVGSIPLDIQTAFSIDVDLATYTYNATLDFGVENPDADSGTVTFGAELRNLTESDITVTGFTVDNAVFSAGAPALPFTVAAGQSVAASLAFDPVESGVMAAVLSVTVDGTDLPFLLNLSGEGNYPPVADAIVQVSGAGTTEANGTYYRTDELQNTYPVYRLTGTDYRIYGADLDGIAWLFDVDFDDLVDLYSLFSGTYTAPNGAPPDWFPSAGAAPGPTTVGEIKSSSAAVYDLPPGDVISPNYRYSDAEGDTEGSTTFQWSRSDTLDATGAYSPIPGETGLSYTVLAADDGYYLKVLVTPVATGGLTTGEPVWFGPSPVVFFGGQ